MYILHNFLFKVPLFYGKNCLCHLFIFFFMFVYELFNFYLEYGVLLNYQEKQLRNTRKINTVKTTCNQISQGDYSHAKHIVH